MDPTSHQAREAALLPEVVADTKNNQMFVLGGGPTLNSPEKTDFDDYEVFVPGTPGVNSQGFYQTRVVGTTTTQLYPGPTDDVGGGPLPPLVNSHRFYQYPRAYLVSTGQIVIVGMANITARATHVPNQATVWTDLSTSGAPVVEAFRYYGSSVRFPNLNPAYEDTLMIAAGHVCLGGGCSELATAQWSKATASSPGAWPTGHTWGPSPPLPSLQFARGCLNLVLLPTAGILALGGQTGFPTSPSGWIQFPELWANGASTWTSLLPDPSRRGYHGTALLLGDATVYSGGSNIRDFDHTRFIPPYLLCGLPRPAFAAPLPGPLLSYNTGHTTGFSLTPGAAIAKVVLMRPGSVTHHFDTDQRYVQLKFEPSPDGSNALTFYTPDRDKTPPGYWMLFLVTAAGTPSLARWVQLP